MRLETYFASEKRGIPACRSGLMKLMAGDAKMGLGKETISKERADEGAACELDVSAPKAAFVEKWQTMAFLWVTTQFLDTIFI